MSYARRQRVRDGKLEFQCRACERWAAPSGFCKAGPSCLFGITATCRLCRNGRRAANRARARDEGRRAA